MAGPAIDGVNDFSSSIWKTWGSNRWDGERSLSYSLRTDSPWAVYRPGLSPSRMCPS